MEHGAVELHIGSIVEQSQHVFILWEVWRMRIQHTLCLHLDERGCGIENRK